MSKTSISLRPAAGFCIKSATIEPSVYTPPKQHLQPGTLEIESPNIPIHLPKGLKIFVNIAWDKNVPPPPEGSEDAIQHAMMGEQVDELNPDGWYVPVVVSEGRPDMDKAGQPCLVFDCIYNASLKSRTLRDPEFKIFLIELALQRIEAQTHILLSRQIKTPNIASKGKLEPRTVSIPTSLLTHDSSAKTVQLDAQTQTQTTKTLIEELPPFTPTGPQSQPRLTNQDIKPNQQASVIGPARKPKGILKNPPGAAASPSSRTNGGDGEPRASPSTKSASRKRPSWTWFKENERIVIVVRMPGVTRMHITNATLDIEPRRVILNVPPLYGLDIHLDLSDAEIAAFVNASQSGNAESGGLNNGVGRERAEENTKELDSMLTLKRQRDLDVDGATAEWRVGEDVLVLHV